jgi:predicted ATP-grasp superfamily ATP-dependent carboligase
MKRAAMKVPAVVVGADINGLGVVRSLAREGVPTYLVDCDRKDPSMRTRHPVKLTFPSLSGTEVSNSLLTLRRRFVDNPVLFLTRDATVKTVGGTLDRIASCYRISMPDARLMEQLMDKVQFQQLAQHHGFAIPRAVHLRRTEDLNRSDRLDYPVVLKPVVKTPAYEGRFKKAYKVESPAHLRAVFENIDGAAQMIAQEWIEGGDDQIYFCLQYRDGNQRTVASFTGRKLRSWPPATGGTASCVPAPEHADLLTQLTDSFFGAIGFFGLGSMEFKRDARTGRFMMIEPTVGRTDFQEEVATLNGVNIPYAAYCSEIGREIPPLRRVSPPVAWAVASIDRWSSELAGQSSKGFPDGMRRYDALWRMDDPLPWCYTMMQRVKSKLSRINRPPR